MESGLVRVSRRPPPRPQRRSGHPRLSAPPRVYSSSYLLASISYLQCNGDYTIIFLTCQATSCAFHDARHAR